VHTPRADYWSGRLQVADVALDGLPSAEKREPLNAVPIADTRPLWNDRGSVAAVRPDYCNHGEAGLSTEDARALLLATSVFAAGAGIGFRQRQETGPVDRDPAYLGDHLGRKAAKHGIVLEQVRERRSGGEVVDRNHLNIGVLVVGRAHKAPANPAKSIDRYKYGAYGASLFRCW
jgi:hypothetical protein